MASVDKTGDLTWGFLEDTEIYGRKAETSDFIRVSGDSLKPEHQVKLKHEASHCLLYAKNNAKVFGIYHPRATILMQVRFDGYIGFPGGIIDEGEDAVFSLNRELKEEMHLDSTEFSVKPSDHVISHFNEKIGLRLYFYALEVSLDQLKKIETSALQAKDYGSEVLGTIRVPLYTMGDGYRGFPVFLKHQFIGNSREQLLYTIKHLNLLTEEEINRAGPNLTWQLIKQTSTGAFVLDIIKNFSILTSINKTGDLTWGLEDTEICARKVETSDFICVSGDALKPEHQVQLKNEVSHCFLYAKNTEVSGIHNPGTTILMQIRSDGYIGFPGGGIDEGEDAVFALNRELNEEMDLDLTKFSVKPCDHVISHFNPKIGLRQYFYALEVSAVELKKIETSALQAKDYGSEVLGTIRVPLYTMDDGYRGFPVFLKHQFIGNAREQLLYTIKYLNLLAEEEINRAVRASKR